MNEQVIGLHTAEHFVNVLRDLVARERRKTDGS
jgi:hypothetical protein